MCIINLIKETAFWWNQRELGEIEVKLLNFSAVNSTSLGIAHLLILYYTASMNGTTTHSLPGMLIPRWGRGFFLCECCVLFRQRPL